jgi:hypothetical protein
MAEKVNVAALRRQRYIDHPVEGGKHTLVLEVPSDRKFYGVFEQYQGLSDPLLACEMIKACIVGWKDVKASDLLSSGTEDAAEFDAAAAGDWIDDHAEWWDDGFQALFQAREQRKAQREADRKN